MLVKVLRVWLTKPVVELPPKMSAKLKQWPKRGTLEVVKVRALPRRP